MRRNPNKSLSIVLAVLVAWLPFAGFGLTIDSGDTGATAAMHAGHVGHALMPDAASSCASDACAEVAETGCCPEMFCAPGGCCSGFSATVPVFAFSPLLGHALPALDLALIALPPDRANLRYRPPRA